GKKKSSTISGTTVWDLICNMPASFLGYSSVCTLSMSSPVRESVWRSYNASWRGTEGACGRKARLTRVQPSISPCRMEAPDERGRTQYCQSRGYPVGGRQRDRCGVVPART